MRNKGYQIKANTQITLLYTNEHIIPVYEFSYHYISVDIRIKFYTKNIYINILNFIQKIYIFQETKLFIFKNRNM